MFLRLISIHIIHDLQTGREECSGEMLVPSEEQKGRRDVIIFRYVIPGLWKQAVSREHPNCDELPKKLDMGIEWDRMFTTSRKYMPPNNHKSSI